MTTGFQRDGFQDTAFQVPDLPAFQTSGFQQDAFQELPGGGVTVLVTNVTATAAIGAVTVTGTANTSVTGVVATGSIGTVTVSVGTNVSVSVTG